MKICIIVDDYMPNSIKIAAKMMHELALEFIKNGHEVSVLTPDTKINDKLQIDTLDGVTIYRFKSGEIKNISKIKRAINETLLSYNGWTACKDELVKNRHDLIIYYSPTIFFGSLVKKLKKLWEAPSYLILRDIFPQWVIDNNILKEDSLITRYFKYFETINYKNANTIGLMSEKNLLWFNKQYKNMYQTEVLYNWTSNVALRNITKDYRKELNLDNKVIYFYGGNMGQAQDMLNLLKLAKNMLNEEQAHFLFVGTGDEIDIMKNYIMKEKLTNTTMLPSVNQKEFLNILSQIDVGLFSLNCNHTTDNFPGKLLGYMCESKPIVGSINPGNDLKKVVEDANAGLISTNGEDELLYTNAKYFLNEKNRLTIGTNANNLLQKRFSVETAVEKILASF